MTMIVSQRGEDIEVSNRRQLSLKVELGIWNGNRRPMLTVWIHLMDLINSG